MELVVVFVDSGQSGSRHIHYSCFESALVSMTVAGGPPQDHKLAACELAGVHVQLSEKTPQIVNSVWSIQ